MARLTGGLFSTPSGSNSGLTFGKARTADGKKVTVRQYSKPTNPNTNLQQAQRTRFSYALEIVQGLTPGINQLGWDRAVKQLPAFQSLMSIFLKAVDVPDGTITAPSPVHLGNLHTPETVSVTAADGSADVVFSSELGVNGNADDIIHAVALLVTPSGDPANYNVSEIANATRADGTVSVSGDFQTSDSVLVIVWAENAAPTNQGASEFSEAVFVESA